MKAKKKTIGIVVSKFNDEITKAMLDAALKTAKELGIEVAQKIEVTGAFEIPFATKQLLEKKEISGVATLGSVIKGETDHDQVIAHSVAKKLLDLSCEYNKPVSLGISGPNISREQATARAFEYGRRGVVAVFELMKK